MDLPWGDAPTPYTRKVRASVLGRLYEIAFRSLFASGPPTSSTYARRTSATLIARGSAP